MNKTASICVLTVFAGVVLVAAIAAPNVLSDDNGFLRSFVGAEFLSILGVILAITLASSGQLHLAFNQIEERLKQEGLAKTRAAVRTDTYALIVLFLLAIAVVVVKSLLAFTLWAQTLFNGAALLILVWNVLLLISLTRTIFAIPPMIDDG